MATFERRHAELRTAPGRRIVGVAMQYGAEARVLHPSGAEVVERFAAFSFSDYLRSGAATRLNLMHDSTLNIATTADGSLRLSESPAELFLAATLPPGDAYDRALALVSDGSTAETSVEFRALRERVDGDRRTVLQATLPGVAIVDRGAYGDAGAVEVRRRGRGLSGEFRYGRDRVTRDRGRRRKVRVRSGAFSWQLAEFQRVQEELQESIAEAIAGGAADAVRDRAREVQLLAGRSYDAPLASLRTGTLKLEDTDDALRFEVDRLPDTTAARDLRAGMDAGAADYGVDVLYSVAPAEAVDVAPVEVIPDPDNPDVEIEVVNRAVLQALAVVSRAPRGNAGRVEKRGIVTPARRVRPWL